jgi:flagellar hook-basal body complex protein FliE
MVTTNMSVQLNNIGLRIMPADIADSAAPKFKSGGEEPAFSDSLRNAVSEVDNLSLDARYKVSSLMENGGADVHDAMIAVQKADLSFQLMLQVRNKVVQAYQQIAGMQF